MLSPMGDRGLLVAFEGVDGAGKSVQADLLARALEARGTAVRLLREPGGTALGERLRQVLLARVAPGDPLVEALLFMASRRQLVVEEIEPGLRQGEVVLLDRSFVSTWVYQGILGGVDPDFLDRLARRVHGAAWPDRILLLDVDAAEAQRRRRGRAATDGFEDRGRAYLGRAAEAFRAIAARHPDLVRVVDGALPPAAVAARCLGLVDELLAARDGAQA